MKALNVINFYLTKPIYEELVKEHRWARRIHNLNRKPVYVTLSLRFLYFKGFIKQHTTQYVLTTPNPNGLDSLLAEEQVILLIQSSKLIGLPELSYLAAALHQENIQNKL